MLYKSRKAKKPRLVHTYVRGVQEVQEARVVIGRLSELQQCVSKVMSYVGMTACSYYRVCAVGVTVCISHDSSSVQEMTVS